MKKFLFLSFVFLGGATTSDFYLNYNNLMDSAITQMKGLSEEIKIKNGEILTEQQKQNKEYQKRTRIYKIENELYQEMTKLYQKTTKEDREENEKYKKTMERLIPIEVLESLGAEKEMIEWEKLVLEVAKLYKITHQRANQEYEKKTILYEQIEQVCQKSIEEYKIYEKEYRRIITEKVRQAQLDRIISEDRAESERGNEDRSYQKDKTELPILQEENSEEDLDVLVARINQTTEKSKSRRKKSMKKGKYKDLQPALPSSPTSLTDSAEDSMDLGDLNRNLSENSLTSNEDSSNIGSKIALDAYFKSKIDELLKLKKPLVGRSKDNGFPETESFASENKKFKLLSASPKYPNNVEREIVKAIQKAEKSITIFMSDLRSDRIADAIRRANSKNPDLQITIVVDKKSFEDLRAGSTQLDEVLSVLPRGIELYKADLGESLFHAKLMIIDGKDIYDGSYNYSIGSNKNNLDHVFLSTDEEEARHIQEMIFQLLKDQKLSKHFNKDYELKKVDEKTFAEINRQQARDKKNSIQMTFDASRVESHLLFPGKEKNGGDIIANQIRKAEERIDVASYNFTNSTIIRELLLAALNGIEVNVFVDKSNFIQIKNPDSGEGEISSIPRTAIKIGLAQIIRDIRMNGIDIDEEKIFSQINSKFRLISVDMGKNKNDNPHLMHAKIMIIDGKVLCEGSFNYTNAAENNVEFIRVINFEKENPKLNQRLMEDVLKFQVEKDILLSEKDKQLILENAKKSMEDWKGLEEQLQKIETQFNKKREAGIKDLQAKEKMLEARIQNAPGIGNLMQDLKYIKATLEAMKY